MITLEGLLKNKRFGLRLQAPGAWLYYDEDACEWVVMKHFYGKRPIELARCKLLQAALSELVNAIDKDDPPTETQRNPNQ